MAYKTSRERFEELVEKAIGTLPEEYTRFFSNITIIVEDYPGPEDTKRLNRGGGFAGSLQRGALSP